MKNDPRDTIALRPLSGVSSRTRREYHVPEAITQSHRSDDICGNDSSGNDYRRSPLGLRIHENHVASARLSMNQPTSGV
jgi:hypothetical protein